MGLGMAAVHTAGKRCRLVLRMHHDITVEACLGVPSRLVGKLMPIGWHLLSCHQGVSARACLPAASNGPVGMAR